MPSTRPFISFLLNLSSSSSAASGHQPKGPPMKQPSGSPTKLHSTGNSLGQHHGLFKPASNSPNAEQCDTEMLLPSLSTSTQQVTSGNHQTGTGLPANANYSDRRNSSSSLNPNEHAKWWIGGRSADGSERYYRLNTQPLQRQTSVDGISLDRMSI